MILTQDSVSVRNWSTLYRSQLTTFFISALLTRRHPGLLPAGNQVVLPRRVLTKEGTICSTIDFIFGNKSASVLFVSQDLKTEEDRRVFSVAQRTSEQLELPGLSGK